MTRVCLEIKFLWSLLDELIMVSNVFNLIWVLWSDSGCYMNWEILVLRKWLINWNFSNINYWGYSIWDFRNMTRVRDTSIDGDNDVQVDKLSLAYIKHFGIGCLVGIWFKFNGIIYWIPILCWKYVIRENLIFECRMDGC